MSDTLPETGGTQDGCAGGGRSRLRRRPAGAGDEQRNLVQVELHLQLGGR